MMRFIFLLSMYICDAMSNPASCTEDSQCPTGFYCELYAHFCRECLRCNDLKRENPQPPVLCIKSVLQCGPCFKGSISKVSSEKLGADCVVGEGYGSAHAYLPTYGWVAIGIGLSLLVVMLSAFLKMKVFNVTAYSSSASVRAADGIALCETVAPPPYNYSSLHPAFPQEHPEIQRLVESPQLEEKSNGPGERPREMSTSQAAAMYNTPAYGSTVTEEELSARMRELDTVLHSHGEGQSQLTNDHSGRNSNDVVRPACTQEQDSNNNRSTPEGSHQQGSPSGERTDDAPSRDTFIVFGGPSVVINNSLRQCNDIHFSRHDSS